MGCASGRSLPAKEHGIHRFKVSGRKQAKLLGLEAKVLGDPGNRSFSAGDAGSTTGSSTGDCAYPRKQTLLDRGKAGSNLDLP